MGRPSQRSCEMVYRGARVLFSLHQGVAHTTCNSKQADLLVLGDDSAWATVPVKTHGSIMVCGPIGVRGGVQCSVFECSIGNSCLVRWTWIGRGAFLTRAVHTSTPILIRTQPWANHTYDGLCGRLNSAIISACTLKAARLRVGWNAEDFDGQEWDMAQRAMWPAFMSPPLLSHVARRTQKFAVCVPPEIILIIGSFGLSDVEIAVLAHVVGSRALRPPRGSCRSQGGDFTQSLFAPQARAANARIMRALRADIRPIVHAACATSTRGVTRVRLDCRGQSAARHHVAAVDTGGKGRVTMAVPPTQHYSWPAWWSAVVMDVKQAGGCTEFTIMVPLPPADGSSRCDQMTVVAKHCPTSPCTTTVVVNTTTNNKSSHTWTRAQHIAEATAGHSTIASSTHTYVIDGDNYGMHAIVGMYDAHRLRNFAEHTEPGTFSPFALAWHHQADAEISQLWDATNVHTSEKHHTNAVADVPERLAEHVPHAAAVRTFAQATHKKGTTARHVQAAACELFSAVAANTLLHFPHHGSARITVTTGKQHSGALSRAAARLPAVALSATNGTVCLEF